MITWHKHMTIWITGGSKWAMGVVKMRKLESVPRGREIIVKKLMMRVKKGLLVGKKGR